VLPFDVIPGKRSGVDVTFPSVRRVVTDGKSVASVAREHGVTRRTIRQWVAGVGARALDLERLYHHRAQTAPCDAPTAGLLVRWAAVAVELARPYTTTAPRFATDLRLTASQERVEAARHLLALLDWWGDACARRRSVRRCSDKRSCCSGPRRRHAKYHPKSSYRFPVPAIEIGTREPRRPPRVAPATRYRAPSSARRRCQGRAKPAAPRRESSERPLTPPSTLLSARPPRPSPLQVLDDERSGFLKDLWDASLKKFGLRHLLLSPVRSPARSPTGVAPQPR